MDDIIPLSVAVVKTAADKRQMFKKNPGALRLTGDK
jgi:hypothetical protein